MMICGDETTKNLTWTTMSEMRRRWSPLSAGQWLWGAVVLECEGGVHGKPQRNGERAGE